MWALKIPLQKLVKEMVPTWDELQSLLIDCLNGKHLWATALAVFIGTFLFMALKSWWDASQPIDLQASAMQVGNVIPSELAKYDGQDPYRAILLSLRGTILDVSAGKEMYGPGALRFGIRPDPSPRR